MKIILPELNDPEVQTAIQEFKNVTFLPTSNPEQAAEMLQNGEGDSIVTGLNYSSRDVILAFKKSIPLKSAFFSSSFICEKNGQVLALADGGVNKQPNREQLYTIVEDTATTFINYTNLQPKIAMLSYSTHGSGGNNPDLTKIYYVIDQIRLHHPDYLIDGELQLDAAINPTVAAKKAPGSIIKGEANILITPDLNSGNILYKSLEQFGGFTIAGPLIQGFEIPLADLSRGSTAKDIALTIKIMLKLCEERNSK